MTTTPIDPRGRSTDPSTRAALDAPTEQAERRVGSDDASLGAAPRRGHLGRVTALSWAVGAVSALLLPLVAFPGGSEAAITGAALIGFALGWALLAVLSSRRTDQPQRWAAVPAAVMAAVGTALVVLTPDDAALTTSGWFWGPAMLALAVWATLHARRSLDTKARTWLVLPTLAVLALASVGGGYETARVTLDDAAYPMPGRSVDIGGRSLHLQCTGSGSPTVVLESGLGETSTAWTRITDAVSTTSRVCAYDRAGQGWSDSVDAPQDGLALAEDLHTLLDRAGETGPYVLVGHSAGGLYAMTYAAQHPSEVAGMVLLDATNPYDITDSLAGRTGGGSGPAAFLPSLARMGLAQLVPASVWTTMPEPTAGAYRAFATTARAMRNAVDEITEYDTVFAQAQTLTTLAARPLLVLTTADKAQSDPAGYTAQQRFAALSTRSTLRTADTSHQGLLDDEQGARFSVRAITDVVESVRTGSTVPQP